MQLNHTLWSKYAASTLQDDEHYAHSAYFQGNYQRKTAFSVCFLEFFLQSSSKEPWRTSRKDMTLKDSWKKKYSKPSKVTFTSVNFAYNGKSKTVASKHSFHR